MRRERLRVLDGCCGLGLYPELARLPGAQIWGLDFSAEMLERARQTGAYNFLLFQSIEEPIDCSDDFFDGILFSFAAHLVDLDKVLPEILRKLSPGGILVLNFYDPDKDWKESWERRWGEFEHEFLEEEIGDKELNVVIIKKTRW